MKRFIITRTTTIIERTSVGIDSETYAMAYAEREFGNPNGDNTREESIETKITTILEPEANQGACQSASREVERP